MSTRMQSFRKRLERFLTTAPKRLIYGALSLALRNERPKRRLRSTELRRILLLRYDRAGDMIISLPSIRFLRRCAPDASIDVLASDSNARIAACFPDVHEVFILPHTMRSRISLMRRLRSTEYDLVIACITNRSTMIGLLCSYLTQRHGISLSSFRGKKYDLFFHVHSRRGSERTYALEKLLYSIPDAVDCTIENADVRACMQVPDDTLELARSWLNRQGLHERRFALVNISVRTDRNAWTDEGFVRAADVLHERTGEPVVITALPDDMQRAMSLGRRCKAAVVFPATSDVMDVAALVSASRLVLTPDTAIVHMCSALEVPMVGLYCHSDQEPREWGPTRPHLCSIVSSAPGTSVDSITINDVMPALESVIKISHPRVV